MSRLEAQRSRIPTRSARGSARLGLTLRAILFSPTTGFTSALYAAERRARTRRRPAEGWTPAVLTVIGGASLASLWLKVGALLGLREVCPDDRVAGYLTASLVLGGLLALPAYSLWGGVGPPAMRSLRIGATSGELRLIWGAAALPQVFSLLLLLPLDLVIVGTDTYTTTALGDPLSTAWAAFSIALAVSLAVWSAFLFVRGIVVAGETSTARASAAAAVAGLCLAVVVGAVIALSLLAPKEAACPTVLR